MEGDKINMEFIPLQGKQVGVFIKNRHKKFHPPGKQVEVA